MDLEKIANDLFAELNRVRKNPKGSIATLNSLKGHYQGKIFNDKIKTREGISALQNAIADLNNRPSVPELAWSFGLHIAADRHANQLGNSGLVHTEGMKDHKTLPERCQEFVVLRGKLSEVSEFGGETASEILNWLLIDDGLASRKRRNTLLDPAYKYVGIGCCLHEIHGYVAIIILAQSALSLVAPGNDGTYLKRTPLVTSESTRYTVEPRDNQKKVLVQSLFDFAKSM